MTKLDVKSLTLAEINNHIHRLKRSVPTRAIPVPSSMKGTITLKQYEELRQKLKDKGV